MFNNEKKIDLSAGKTYSGRELYESLFISGMNKKPVETLKTHVRSTYIDDAIELPIDMNKLLEVLLVDGSFISMDGKFFNGDIITISTNEAIMKYGDFYLHFFKDAVNVTITKYHDYEDDVLSRQVGEPEVFPSDSVIIYPNSNGILFDAQKTLLRLEEILQILKKTTPLEAIIFFQGGSLNSDAINAKIEAELSTDRPAITLSAGQDIKQPNFSSLSNRLFREYEELSLAYLESTYGYTVNPGESGIARKYSMAKFLSKVEELKNQCIDIYGMLNAVVRFKPSDVTDTDEDEKSIALLNGANALGYISDDEAKARVREILNFDDESVPNYDI